MFAPHVNALLDLAIDEDLGRGDLTTAACISPGAGGHAAVVAREPLVACGANVAAAVFARVAALEGAAAGAALVCADPAADGARCAAGTTLLRVRGWASTLLMGERTALNFLGRLCGIASLAARYRAALDEAGLKGVRVTDTRKTTPGWRVLEKRAVRAGGLHNHRMDLGSGVLVKDNHIAACGSVRLAVERARGAATTPHTVRVQVEVERDDQLDEAIDAGADALLLDNRAPAELARMAARARERARARGAPIVLEASGGVTLANLVEIARSGVDVVSVGALTRGATSADVALDWVSA